MSGKYKNVTKLCSFNIWRPRISLSTQLRSPITCCIRVSMCMAPSSGPSLKYDNTMCGVKMAASPGCDRCMLIEAFHQRIVQLED